MKLFMVGTIKQNGKLTGVRLLDTDTKQIQDIPVDNVVKVISSGKVKVENLQVVGKELKGINGSIDRYGTVGISQSCTILGAYNGADNSPMGYMVSDVNGNVINLTIDNLIGVAEILGVSNGKIVERDGRRFISAIEGNYEVLNAKKNESDKAAIIKEQFPGAYIFTILSDDKVVVFDGKSFEGKLGIFTFSTEKFEVIISECEYIDKYAYKDCVYYTVIGEKDNRNGDASLAIIKMDKDGSYKKIVRIPVKSFNKILTSYNQNCMLIAKAPKYNEAADEVFVLDILNPSIVKGADIYAGYINGKDKHGKDIYISKIRIEHPHVIGVRAKIVIERFNIDANNIICDFVWDYYKKDNVRVILQNDNSGEVGMTYKAYNDDRKAVAISRIRK